MNDAILVIWDTRTLSYLVKTARLDKRGRPLHRTQHCGSAEEAAAVALDFRRKAWPLQLRIVAPANVKRRL